MILQEIGQSMKQHLDEYEDQIFDADYQINNPLDFRRFIIKIGDLL